ncbi:uncharacterized protein [Dermacentor andersoni]|uniref:uncharacterized protein n=1 Tax=Dermacentor andersoni TaxID=34620 RepID=UPI002417B19C|nr:uncharacterized protein LOC126534342 isoform X2 [Dermacentor andersoni]
MTVTNPFVFVVQLSIGLFVSLDGIRMLPAASSREANDTSFVTFHGAKITCSAPWNCLPPSATRPTCDELRHQQPAPLRSAPISSLPPRIASTGHGGTGGMTVANPFAFIVQFFDTTEAIWTVYTTGPTDRRCEVDLVQDVTKASVYFKRQFFLGEEKISRRILGTFNPNRKKHMEIHIPGSNNTAAEDILYMSENKGCAVIMTTANAEDWARSE